MDKEQHGESIADDDVGAGIADKQQIDAADPTEPCKTDDVGGIADDDVGVQPNDAAAIEPYDLTAPEGFEIPEDNLKAFATACHNAGITKEQADKLLAWHKEQADRQKQDASSVVQEWHKEIQADPEFGGSQWNATRAAAMKAFQVFDPDGALRSFLRETQYQHHPLVVRAVARVGRAMTEHGWVASHGQGEPQKPALEDRIWPDMKI